MIINNIVQGTLEWFAVRAGKFTASSDFQVLCTGRPDTYKKLIRKKVAERITSKLCENEYTNANIKRGKELEAEAREAFEIKTGIAVEQIGFCEASEWVGASPDGLISEDAGIEIKCPEIHTHLNCFLDGYDTSYKWQIQGNLWVTGRKIWYFVSYNPEYAHIGKHLFVEQVPRDETRIAQIAAGVERGIKDVQAIAKVFTAEKI